MYKRSLSELQGVSTRRGTSTRRTTQYRASRSSKLRRGSGRRYVCLPRGAPLWAWLLLGALVVPGAWSSLNEEQEELLVELHNHYRGQVSPSASAMLPLKWDSSLTLIAGGYAPKCIWNHNPDLEDTGENLYADTTGSLDLRAAVEKWFLEYLDYDFHNNSCDEDKMCGHYTQMVWADTHRVGCAFHLCNNMEGLSWERVSFLVCNYYPAGNYEDVRPYVEGEWCSRCPENFQKCENNLCAADDVEEGEDEDTTLSPAVPSPATTNPSLQPEEEEEETVVPPPATTDPYVQTATTTASTPSTPTTAARDSEGTKPPSTTSPSTYPPEVYSTTLGKEEKVEEKMKEEEEKVDEKMKKEKEEEEEEEEEKEDERMEEEKRKETTKGERDTAGKIYHNRKAMSAGSARSPSLLFAGLTGILTLRL